MFTKFLLLSIALFISSMIVDAAAVIHKRHYMNCPTNPGGAGLYPDPDDCSSYYYCTAGNSMPEIRKCHDNTLYSAKLRRCVVSSRVDCRR